MKVVFNDFKLIVDSRVNPLIIIAQFIRKS